MLLDDTGFRLLLALLSSKTNSGLFYQTFFYLLGPITAQQTVAL